MAGTFCIKTTDIVPDSFGIGDGQFGIVQTGFGTSSVFSHAFDYLGGDHIRWPGGTLAEERHDIYGLNIPGLFDATRLYSPDPNRQRPDLVETIGFAVQRDIGLSLVVPTSRYVSDFSVGQSDLYRFLSELDAGLYGNLPRSIQLEIGNEFYSRNEFTNNPGLYGALANAFLDTVEGYFADNPSSTLVGVLDIGVQMGRTQAEDIAIRNAIDVGNLFLIDSLIAHHQPHRFDAIDKKTMLFSNGGHNTLVSRPELIALELDAWRSLVKTHHPNGSGPALRLTEWTIGDADSAGSNNLGSQDFGARQASAILEHFATYAEIGVLSADFWGVGIVNQNAIVDEQGNATIGAEMFRILSESLDGKRLLDGFQNFSRSDPVSIYGFRDLDSLDIFVAANDLPTASYDITIDLAGFGPGSSLSAELLGYKYDPSMPIGTTGSDLRLFELPDISKWSDPQIDTSYTETLNQDYSVLHLQFEHSDANLASQYLFGFGSALVETGTGSNETKRALIGLNLLEGGGGDDRVLGGIGSDYLRGGNGDDLLVGDPGTAFFGNDVLEAGTGSDLLMGAAGADQFIFRPGEGTNTIAEFDLLGSKSHRIVGADFSPDLDGLMFLDFGYRSTADIVSNFSTGPHGEITFADQGTVIHFFGLGAGDVSNWDLDFL